MLYRFLLPGALALGTFWLAGCGDTATEPPGSAQPTTEAPDLAVTSNSWITRARLPMTRWQHTLATVTNAAGQSVVYVIGGATAGAWPSTKVAAYNVATNTWSWPRQLPVSVAASNGAGVINGKIYISGGNSRIYEYLPSRALYMFNPSTNTWTRKRDIPIVTVNGEERIGGGRGVTGVINGKLYVVAGCFTLPSDWYEYVESCNPLFFRYDPVTNGWTRLPSPFGSNTPTSSPYGGGVIGGKFYLTATSEFTGDARFSVYDPATNRWSTKPILGGARSGAATAVLGGRLYVMGGSYFASGPLDLTSVFNPTTNLWSQRARLPSPRTGIAGTTVMLNGTARIQVIGGSLGRDDVGPVDNNLQYIP
jgi:N-acetylneuraminic acid mutarotase